MEWLQPRCGFARYPVKRRTCIPLSQRLRHQNCEYAGLHGPHSALSLAHVVLALQALGSVTRRDHGYLTNLGACTRTLVALEIINYAVRRPPKTAVCDSSPGSGVLELAFGRARSLGWDI